MGEGQIESWNTFLENSLSTFEKKYLQRSESQSQPSDYILLKTIGVGSYGQVILVKRKSNDGYYAMKVLEKEKVLLTNQLEHTRNEKRILQAIDFDFIVKMIDFFKDNVYLYMVMPLAGGGDVFTILRRVKSFNDDSAKFYAAQVLLALEYLHFLGIVYRDLKPENLLFSFDGYIKLADLGFSKRIMTRTYTLCGTPEYLAPEVIRNEGYGLSIDWWDFGVLIYEFRVGASPFFMGDYTMMFKAIVVGRYDASVLQPAETRDLVTNLLQVNPTKRLGSIANGAAEVKSHPWFNNIVWLDVLNKKVKPPYRPKLTGPNDISLFGKTEDVTLNTSNKMLFGKEFEDF